MQAAHRAIPMAMALLAECHRFQARRILSQEALEAQARCVLIAHQAQAVVAVVEQAARLGQMVLKAARLVLAASGVVERVGIKIHQRQQRMGTKAEAVAGVSAQLRRPQSGGVLEMEAGAGAGQVTQSHLTAVRHCMVEMAETEVMRRAALLAAAVFAEAVEAALVAQLVREDAAKFACGCSERQQWIKIEWQ